MRVASPTAPVTAWAPAICVAALSGAVFYTIAFIAVEQLARLGVETYGVNEFWFMAAAFLGCIAVILWRGSESDRRSGFSRDPSA